MDAEAEDDGHEPGHDADEGHGKTMMKVKKKMKRMKV